MPTLLERVDDVAALLRRPGTYQTTSRYQAYSVLKALDWDPRVEVTSELFAAKEDVIVVRVDPKRLKRNPEVMGFDPAYWTNKLDGYPHWETAWWRECIQNSRDAGATKIGLECYERDLNGTQTVMCSVSDDGRGMTEDVLRRAFLTFGGSAKEAGSVGGFGDAKELIIIPWLRYEIRTNDLIATGIHNTFDVKRSETPIQGTVVRVWMPREKATTLTYASGLLERCNLPSITFALNGRRVKADAGGGELKEEAELRRDGSRVGVLRIYHNPRSRKRGFLIRARGLYMFEKYVPESQYKGVVYVELEGNARDLFDQKRVNLRWDTGVATMIDEFIAELTVDKSALERKGKGKERKFYDGDRFAVMAGQASETAAQLAMAAPVSEMKKWKDEKVSFDDSQVTQIVEHLERVDAEEERREAERPESAVVVRVPLATRVMLEETKFVGADHAANAMRLVAWKPTFLLVNEVDFYSVPSKARPEGMTPTYRTLLTLWAEICRFTLMRLGWTKPFGVGFIFSWDEDKGTTTLAAYTEEQGVDFLLLNPFKLKIVDKKRDHDGDIVNIKYDDEERWKVSDEETLKMLCAAAVHEATHMVNGLERHNEAFASALTENMGALIDMLPVVKKIRSAVTSRKARAERREAATAKPKMEIVFEQPEPQNRPNYYVVWQHGNIIAEVIGRWTSQARDTVEWTSSVYIGAKQGSSWPMDSFEQAKKWVLERLNAYEKRPPPESDTSKIQQTLGVQWAFDKRDWELWGSTDPGDFPDGTDRLATIQVAGDLFRIQGKWGTYAPQHSLDDAKRVLRHLLFTRYARVLEVDHLEPVAVPAGAGVKEWIGGIWFNGTQVGTFMERQYTGDPNPEIVVYWNGQQYRETQDGVWKTLFFLANKVGASRRT